MENKLTADRCALRRNGRVVFTFPAPRLTNPEAMPSVIRFERVLYVDSGREVDDTRIYDEAAHPLEIGRASAPATGLYAVPIL